MVYITEEGQKVQPGARPGAPPANASANTPLASAEPNQPTQEARMERLAQAEARANYAASLSQPQPQPYDVSRINIQERRIAKTMENPPVTAAASSTTTISSPPQQKSTAQKPDIFLTEIGKSQYTPQQTTPKPPLFGWQKTGEPPPSRLGSIPGDKEKPPHSQKPDIFLTEIGKNQYEPQPKPPLLGWTKIGEPPSQRLGTTPVGKERPTAHLFGWTKDYEPPKSRLGTPVVKPPTDDKKLPLGAIGTPGGSIFVVDVLADVYKKISAGFENLFTATATLGTATGDFLQGKGFDLSRAQKEYLNRVIWGNPYNVPEGGSVSPPSKVFGRDTGKFLEGEPYYVVKNPVTGVTWYFTDYTKAEAAAKAWSSVVTGADLSKIIGDFAAYFIPVIGAWGHAAANPNEGPGMLAFDIITGFLPFLPEMRFLPFLSEARFTAISEALESLPGRVAVGAAYGATASILQGGSPLDTLEYAVIGAVLGAGAPYAFKGVAKGLGAIGERIAYKTVEVPKMGVLESEGAFKGPYRLSFERAGEVPTSKMYKFGVEKGIEIESVRTAAEKAFGTTEVKVSRFPRFTEHYAKSAEQIRKTPLSEKVKTPRSSGQDLPFTSSKKAVKTFERFNVGDAFELVHTERPIPTEKSIWLAEKFGIEKPLEAKVSRFEEGLQRPMKPFESLKQEAPRESKVPSGKGTELEIRAKETAERAFDPVQWSKQYEEGARVGGGTDWVRGVYRFNLLGGRQPVIQRRRKQIEETGYEVIRYPPGSKMQTKAVTQTETKTGLVQFSDLLDLGRYRFGGRMKTGLEEKTKNEDKIKKDEGKTKEEDKDKRIIIPPPIITEKTKPEEIPRQWETPFLIPSTRTVPITETIPRQTTQPGERITTPPFTPPAGPSIQERKLQTRFAPPLIPLTTGSVAGGKGRGGIEFGFRKIVHKAGTFESVFGTQRRSKGKKKSPWGL